jgi:integration host factor subunit alpha
VRCPILKLLREPREGLIASKNVIWADLVQAAYAASGLPRDEAAAVVEQVLSEITNTLVTGESVKLSGFGVFTVRDRAKLVGRTPDRGRGAG